MDLAAAVAGVVDQLVAGGVRAGADMRNQNPPFALVAPPVMIFKFGKGWSAEWTVTAVVADSGFTESMAAMGTLIEQVRDALGAVVVEARPTSGMSLDGAELPAYDLTWVARIPASPPGVRQAGQPRQEVTT